MNLDVPANRLVLRLLERRAARWRGLLPALPPGAAPDDVPDAYMSLGTHPDLVTRIWDELNAGLPCDCRWIVHAAPSLVHPDSGVLFAFAAGSAYYALRLPPPEREQAARAGALPLAGAGDEWMQGRWFTQETRWCLAAYQAAANA